MSGSTSLAAGADGWRVLGATVFVPGIGNDANARRYDASGACTSGEAVFADGFDTAAE